MTSPIQAAQARARWLLPLLLAAVSHPNASDAAEVARFRELSHGAFQAPQPAAVTDDGTVIGADMASGNALRWKPAGEPEDLGGGPTFSVINVTPVVSPDGRMIVANYMHTEGERMLSVPRLWQGATDWAAVPDMPALSTLVMGISADGSQLVGYGGDPDANFRPWQWSAQTGQRMLPVPATMESGEAWAVSNDGRVAAGHVSRMGTDSWGWPLRYWFGARWVDGELALLDDANGHALGQAVACNADCSILIGGGIGGDDAPHPDRGRAWYWTAADGAVYLDTSRLPAEATMPYYAMAISADGSVIVGAYTVESETPAGVVRVSRPFRWTRPTGAEDLVGWMSAHGIAFGGEGWDLVPSSISPDGRTILLNGQDADYNLRSGVLSVIEDAIFADGFEGAAARR